MLLRKQKCNQRKPHKSTFGVRVEWLGKPRLINCGSAFKNEHIFWFYSVDLNNYAIQARDCVVKLARFLVCDFAQAFRAWGFGCYAKPDFSRGLCGSGPVCCVCGVGGCCRGVEKQGSQHTGGRAIPSRWLKDYSVGSPAAIQAPVPPATLMTGRPVSARYSATRMLRPPA
ncbi:hypothetical protein CMUST_13440 [Corynebacterium mustelae]|uniref:Uncharacterized protein n=1 Tax=Corynebacterium mustelae TaxID=571915 RepID=A0A0G3H742_9CORY|nr:hypothetical protein CMUST_13440 [Corynebacterium mustelae]